jgi:hypothetical protein
MGNRWGGYFIELRNLLSASFLKAGVFILDLAPFYFEIYFYQFSLVLTGIVYIGHESAYYGTGFDIICGSIHCSCFVVVVVTLKMLL